MRVLIDECLNLRLVSRPDGAFFASIAKMGWSGISNGQLLALAEQDSFDVFLTGDRNLRFQQNIANQRIAVVILEGAGIQLHQTLPLMPKALAVLPTLRPGQVVRIAP